jgi:hypothetical protein
LVLESENPTLFKSQINIDAINKGHFVYNIDSHSFYWVEPSLIRYGTSKLIKSTNHLLAGYVGVTDNQRFAILDYDKKLNIYYKGILESVVDLEKVLNKKIELSTLRIFKNNDEITLAVGKELYRLSLEFKKTNLELLNDYGCYDETCRRVNFKPNKNIDMYYSSNNGLFIFQPNIFRFQTSNQIDKYKNEIYRVLVDKNNKPISLYSDKFRKLNFIDKFTLAFNKTKDTICILNKDSIYYVVNERVLKYKLEFANPNDKVMFFHDAFLEDGLIYILAQNKIFTLIGSHHLVKQVETKTDILSVQKIKNSNNLLLALEYEGLAIYDLSKQKYNILTQFKDKEVRFIQYDKKHDLYWIFTYGSGIFLIDSELRVRDFFKDRDGLFIFSHYFMNDSDGDYWIPSNLGLIEIKNKEVELFIQNKNKVIRYNYYDSRNGLVNKEFNGRFSNSGIQLSDGRFALSNMSGLVEVDPNSQSYKQTSFPIIIDKVQKDNKVLSRQSIYYLREGFSEFSIKLVWSNFDFMEISSIEYFIPEISDKWNLLSDRNLKLISLKSGTYNVYFRKSNDTQNEELVKIKIVVSPPWYSSNWAFIVYFLLFILLGYVISRNYFRMRQRKLKNELILMESELKALRAQINPHYLSNSLMSLQSVVLDNDKEKAYEFISQYGKVMRSILEKSDYTFIPLEQEIETLNEYVKLEGLIRDISIDFECLFYSDRANATLTNVKVPTMIFQPFVENAIIHGLVPQKQQLNRIQLDVKLKDKLLNVIITDNGVGYNKKISERKSYGLDNIQNRLKAYSKLLKNESFFKIENIGEVSGSETGTRVTLNIPYLIEPENKN